jgi:hypothetical protein
MITVICTKSRIATDNMPPSVVQVSMMVRVIPATTLIAPVTTGTTQRLDLGGNPAGPERRS